MPLRTDEPFFTLAETPLAEPGLGQYLGSKVSESLVTNPIAQLYRFSEQRAANAYEDEDLYLQPHEMAAQLDQLGMTGMVRVDEPLSLGAFNARITYARRINHLQSIAERRKAGVVVGGLGLAASIGGAFVDPIGLPLNFVPVVGQARYAAMLGKASGALGRAGVRATAGAIEGAVGASLWEPFAAVAETDMGQDYGIYNTFSNVAFGTLFGSTVQVLGGAAGDFLARKFDGTNATHPIEVKQQLLAATLDDILAGHQPLRAAIMSAAEVNRTRIDALQAKAARIADLDARMGITPVGYGVDLVALADRNNKRGALVAEANALGRTLDDHLFLTAINGEQSPALAAIYTPEEMRTFSDNWKKVEARIADKYNGDVKTVAPFISNALFTPLSKADVDRVAYAAADLATMARKSGKAQPAEQASSIISEIEQRNTAPDMRQQTDLAMDTSVGRMQSPDLVGLARTLNQLTEAQNKAQAYEKAMTSAVEAPVPLGPQVVPPVPLANMKYLDNIQEVRAKLEPLRQRLAASDIPEVRALMEAELPEVRERKIAEIVNDAVACSMGML